MTKVMLYSEQFLAAAGFEAAVAEQHDFKLLGSFRALESLQAQIGKLRPSVILLELTNSITFAALSELRRAAGTIPMVLWVDVATLDFISEALSLGVRGVLYKSLPLEMQLECLRRVAQGELLVDAGICNPLLNVAPVALTAREREFLALVAQGMKNEEIALAMGLKDRMAQVYVNRVCQKVGARGRFELALFAVKNSLTVAERNPEACLAS